MTLLFHEVTRHTDFDATALANVPLLDTFTMHYGAFPSWEGKRRLGALCEHFGVVLDILA